MKSRFSETCEADIFFSGLSLKRDLSQFLVNVCCLLGYGRSGAKDDVKNVAGEHWKSDE